MNKTRREAIAKASESIAKLYAEFEKQLATFKDNLDEAKTGLEELRDEEQESFDNLPESLQSGDRGQVSEAAIGQLDEAISEVENLADELDAISLDQSTLLGALEAAAE